MMYSKKMTVLSGLALAILCATAAVRPGAGERNLKVLPGDISDAKLDSIMQTYNKALGVNCRFCHVPVRGYADSLDFASDLEPMKENARDMMRMVIDINKNNFWYNKNERPEYLHTVTCKTCHRGEAFPPE